MSKELVRIRKKSFTEGMATSTEVIDAEVMLSKVQIASLLAYYQYDVALINLLSACGIPDTFYQYSFILSQCQCLFGDFGLSNFFLSIQSIENVP